MWQEISPEGNMNYVLEKLIQICTSLRLNVAFNINIATKVKAPVITELKIAEAVYIFRI